jgi:hypothetical protein
VSGALLRDLLELLVDGAKGAVRLRLEGRSSAQGSPPAWVEQAAAFELIAIEEGSTQLVLEAASVADAAPEQFAQVELFGGVDGSRSCIELLADSLDDALSSKGDSDLYDDGLLTTFERFERVFRHGVQTIELANGRRVRVERDSVGRLQTLKRNIPADQRVVVSGKLDALRHSDRMFTLVLEDGTSIRGVLASGSDLEGLGKLWGKQAKITGVAKFRPSGAVLRLEADGAEEVNGEPSVWSAAPRPLFRELDTRTLRQLQGPRRGIAAIFGKWPGDESDEEFLRAVAELS